MAKSIQQLMLPGDCLLVKGSNATEMSCVVRAALHGRSRAECAAPRHWSLAAEMAGTTPPGNPPNKDITSTAPTALHEKAKAELARAVAQLNYVAVARVGAALERGVCSR